MGINQGAQSYLNYARPKLEELRQIRDRAADARFYLKDARDKLSDANSALDKYLSSSGDQDLSKHKTTLKNRKSDLDSMITKVNNAISQSVGVISAFETNIWNAEDRLYTDD